MSSATKSAQKPAAAPKPVSEKIPVTAEIDGDVHAKIEAFRNEVEGLTGVRISGAAAVRKILTDWAKTRPAVPAKPRV